MTLPVQAAISPHQVRARRPRVLFVGAFNTSNAAVRGGQLQACTSLLGSTFASQLDLVLLDTTQISVPPPPFRKRAAHAATRLGSALKALLFSRIDGLLVFCADGASFVEKGVVVCIARLLGKRVVLAPRSGYLLDDYRRSAVWRAVIRLVLKASSVVVCQGRSWQEFFVRAGARAEQCLILKNWVSAPDLRALPLAARHPGPLRILYLGWLEPAKGVFDLVAAIDDVMRSGRAVTAVLAGDGSARQQLQADLVRRRLEAHVTLFGWASAVQRCELMSRTEIVVMPSHQEGMPNAVLEAMAAGRAVVATRVGAVPDVIREGENGLLVEPGDVAMLAARLRQLCDQSGLVESLGDRARRTIEAEHDLEQAARSLVRALTGTPAR
jgi:glycosyltransferase involved in cell wall biosynthesis